MKITKARLKEIINEELERAMTPEESAADGHAAAAEMRDRIRQDQTERGYEPDHLPRLKDELLDLYRQEHEQGPSRGLTNAIGALELKIQDLEI